MSDADILAKLARWVKENPEANAGDHAGEELLELVRSIGTPPAPLTPAVPQTAPMGFGAALDLAQEGFDRWREKPHNAKWFRRIDGTPIPNDLLVNIAEIFARSCTLPRPK